MPALLIILLSVFIAVVGIPAVKYLYLMVWDKYRPPAYKEEAKKIVPRDQQSSTRSRPMKLDEVEMIVNQIKFKEIQ